MKRRLLIALSCALATATAGIAAPSKPAESPVVRKLVLHNLLPSEAAKTMGGIKTTGDSRGKKVSIPRDALTMEVKNEAHTLILRGPKEEVDQAEELITQLDATPALSGRLLVRLLRVPAQDMSTYEETTLAAQTVDFVSGNETVVSLPCDVNMKSPYKESKPGFPEPLVQTRYQVVIVPHIMPAVKKVSFGVDSTVINTTFLQPWTIEGSKKSLPDNPQDGMSYRYYGTVKMGAALRSTLYLEPANGPERYKHILEITPLPAVSSTPDVANH